MTCPVSFINISQQVNATYMFRIYDRYFLKSCPGFGLNSQNKSNNPRGKEKTQ